MDHPTLWLLLAFSAASISGFIGYWWGVGIAEKRHYIREQQLLTELDASVDTVRRLCRDRHPVGKDRHLTLVQGGAS